MGNSKPMYFIYYHPEQGDPFSVAIDLYRTKYNVRVFRDAVSLLEIGRLTCDLSEDDYKSCKEHLFGLINDEKKSGFGKKQRNKISNRFKEQELFFVFDRLGAYYASACEDVVRALGPAFSYNLLEETGTTPTSATRKQAEFVINAAPELYTTVRNNQFPQDFKDTFIPYLKLSVNFREFVSNHLPASYLAKLDQHNKDVAGYLAKDVTP